MYSTSFLSRKHFVRKIFHLIPGGEINRVQGPGPASRRAPRAQSGLFFLMGPACSVTCTLGPRELRAQRPPPASQSLTGCKPLTQHRGPREQRGQGPALREPACRRGAHASPAGFSDSLQVCSAPQAHPDAAPTTHPSRHSTMGQPSRQTRFGGK